MDRNFNQGDPGKYHRESVYQKEGEPKRQQQGEGELVEFHSEMPKVPDEDLEFIPDEKLEEEIDEEL